MIRAMGIMSALLGSVLLMAQDPPRAPTPNDTPPQANGTAPQPDSTAPQVTPSPSHGRTDDCAACHACSKPTAESPCLRACPRTRSTPSAPPDNRGPDMIVLDAFAGEPGIEDLFLPVPFDHRGHATMAEMAGGCTVCHHHTPEGGAHPACRTCHEVAPARENIRMPGLKGAYHRQCINCHRDWSHETACDICHMPRTGEASGDQKLPSHGDILGKMHPPIPEPDTEFYQLESGDAPGKRVIFRHKEHIHRFGISCASCHQDDSCQRCHEVGNQHRQREITLAEHHSPCAACHQVDAPERCGRCHWEEGQPQPPPFDHASTGWPLSRHHRELTCRKCHEQIPFVAPDPTCDACHGAWNRETFDHGVVGLRLDETHGEFDCVYCHVDRRFDAPPACADCHDEDQGISYPERKPGTTTPPENTPAGPTP